jgi:ssDNA-binding Zn-finger/Zn-ribbon topoisomerase 1
MTAPVVIQDEDGPMVACPRCRGYGGATYFDHDERCWRHEGCPDCDESGLVPYVAETGTKPKLAKSEPPPANECPMCGGLGTVSWTDWTGRIVDAGCIMCGAKEGAGR